MVVSIEYRPCPPASILYAPCRHPRPRHRQDRHPHRLEARLHPTSKMFRHGSDLAADVVAPTNTVEVQDAAGFNVDDNVKVFDPSNKEGEDRTITAINGNVFTLDADLQNNYTADPNPPEGRGLHGHVGRLTNGFYEADPDALAGLWEHAFVEVDVREEGSGVCPLSEALVVNTGEEAFSNAWFHKPSNDRENYFHLIGAHTASDDAFGGAVVPNHPANAILAYVHKIETKWADAGDRAKANRNITAHEFTHMFDNEPIPGQVTGKHHIAGQFQHGVVPEANEVCVMNTPRDRTLPSRWCIFHVYSTRDEEDAKQ